MDFKKLTETAIEAVKKANEAAQGEDGGTCNLDAVFLSIPRINSVKIITALEKGGLRAYKSRFFRWFGYILNPPKCGQANSRVRACNAIREVFKDAGYDVHDFSMMD